MRQIGVVAETCGEKVKVRVGRATACNHCGQCSAAERRVRSLLEPPKEILVEAFNQAQAAVGQTVELSMPNSTVLVAAVWAYLIPWLAFLSGAFLGHWLGPSLGIGQQGGSIILSVVFLAGGYGLLRWKNKRLEGDRRFLAQVERVL